MRVASNSFTDSLVGQLNNLTAQQYNLQNQASTGLRIQAPADDPEGMQNTLDYLANASAQNQYSSNIAALQSHAGSAYNVMQSLQTLVSRAGEIATLAANSTASQDTLNNYANEVGQLVKQAVQLVNTKDPATGTAIFGGTAGGQQAFAATTNANGDITAVTYQGNNSVNSAEIADGVTVSADVPGADTSGSGVRGLVTDSSSGADLFNHLISLQNNLRAGNTAAISSTNSPDLQKDENNLAYQVSNNGVIQSRLNAAATTASTVSSSLNQSISNASGADIVQTIMQLNRAQNSYQAALASGAKIMQLSLVNYIQ